MSAIGRLLEGPVARWSYRRHQSVAVSDSTSAAMRSRLRWTGPIHVIPNGVAPECFIAAGGADPDDGRAASAVSLVMVGRLVAHKRVERVLDVADRLGPAVTIDVVGRGPQAGPLGQEIARRGLAGIVRLRGYLADERKRAVVAGAALHLNASQGEGWGLCVLEAAALGVPTVAYDVDGLRDAVRDGETGWLVRAGESLADVTELALKELANPARKAQIALACRRWAAQFDWDASVDQMASLIGSVTHRLHRGGAPGQIGAGQDETG
jgi:glycosyltransferase involved in cell wall biosynthesis